MNLKQARAEAIKQVEETGENRYIYRTAPRKFMVSNDISLKLKLVQVISAYVIQSGWLKKYHPEWFGGQ